MDEFELIRRYFTRPGADEGVMIGVGDDGAVLEPTPGMQQVSVIDTLVEGVHFLEGYNAIDVGYRAVAVNLSDIAAMGAVPRWMTLALAMPSADADWLSAFAEGLYTAAREFGVALVGGDTTSADQVVISVQITGEVRPGSAVTRSGAQPGDAIYVTGTLGDAAAGLDGLKRGTPVRQLVDRYVRPAARVSYGQSLAGVASAAIDISDGLVGDLGRLLSASGVGAVIELKTLPLSAALQDYCGLDAQRRFALSGGDDYELCFTTSATPPDPGVMPLTRIGAIVAGEGLTARLDGAEIDIDDQSYRHFA
ncbi:MAG: thiamine-phosphate kinase [Pseudomonadota bacterium]